MIIRAFPDKSGGVAYVSCENTGTSQRPAPACFGPVRLEQNDVAVPTTQ